MRHHYPIKYCIPIQSFNRNNKVFNIKVHTVIDRCRLVVTQWNKWVTHSFPENVILDDGVSINLNDPDITMHWIQSRLFIQCQTALHFRLATIVLWTRSGAWHGLTLPIVSLRKKNPFFPHAFALRYSNFKAFLLGMQKTWILNLGMNIIMN